MTKEIRCGLRCSIVLGLLLIPTAWPSTSSWSSPSYLERFRRQTGGRGRHPTLTEEHCDEILRGGNVALNGLEAASALYHRVNPQGFGTGKSFFLFFYFEKNCRDPVIQLNNHVYPCLEFTPLAVNQYDTRRFPSSFIFENIRSGASYTTSVEKASAVMMKMCCKNCPKCTICPKCSKTEICAKPEPCEECKICPECQTCSAATTCDTCRDEIVSDVSSKDVFSFNFLKKPFSGGVACSYRRGMFHHLPCSTMSSKNPTNQTRMRGFYQTLRDQHLCVGKRKRCL